MKINNPLFLIDFYKADHRRQYPDNTVTVYSNFTPRSNKYAYSDSNEIVVFGIQYLIKEYLMYQWNTGFFTRPKAEVIAEYKALMDRCLGPDSIPADHIEALHDLGYLPILIKALPEGTLCPMGVPVLTIKNTKPEFFWLTNYLETLLSNILWKPMTSASTAFMYRKEFERHAELTGSPKDFIGWQGHDFSFRGMSGVEDACLSGMGHLTSFNGTDTVPAIVAAMKYYPTDEFIGGSVPATEHSVMCMNANYDGGDVDEFESFKRLITEVYPKGIVSIVSDTWDLWKVLTDYLPRLKDEIEARDGRVVIRPDSGDPVDIICGVHSGNTGLDNSFLYGNLQKEFPKYVKDNGITESSWIGAYELLWNIFGGTINDKGYKVLNPKVGLIYGDSINYTRQKDILSRLETKGFTASNLVLGIGSFTYEYVTRDTYGFAMKATYGETLEDNPEKLAGNDSKIIIGREIFKDPITDSGLKKSAKGLLRVELDSSNSYQLIDQVTTEQEDGGQLRRVFEDGTLFKDFSLTEIKNKLNGYLYSK